MLHKLIINIMFGFALVSDNMSLCYLIKACIYRYLSRKSVSPIRKSNSFRFPGTQTIDMRIKTIQL